MYDKKILEKAIGSTMRRIRMEHQLKRDFVATKMGISIVLYAKLEQGAVSIKFSHVLHFCDIIGVDCQYFQHSLDA